MLERESFLASPIASVIMSHKIPAIVSFFFLFARGSGGAAMFVMLIAEAARSPIASAIERRR